MGTTEDLHDRTDENWEEDDFELSYKPFHPIALLAVPVALVGLLSLAFPYLLPVCVVAALMALYAFRQISKSGSFGGTGIAMFGLWLAVVGAVLSISYNGGRQWYVQNTAKTHAKTMLDLIMNNEFEEAISYMTDPMFRQPDNVDLVEYYKGREGKKGHLLPPAGEMVLWKSTPPLSIIVADNRQGKLEHVGYDEYVRDHEYQYVGVLFKYTPKNKELDGSVFRMEMLRKVYNKPFHLQWRFRKFSILSGPTMETGQTRIEVPPTDEEKKATEEAEKKAAEEAENEGAATEEDPSNAEKSGGRQGYVQKTAKTHAQTMLNLIMNNEFEEAISYMTDPKLRQPDNVDLVEFYKEREPTKGHLLPPAGELALWKSMPPVSILVADDRQGKLEHVGFDEYVRDSEYQYVGVLYKYTPKNETLDGSVFRMEILLKEYIMPFYQQWQCRKISILSGPTIESGPTRIEVPPSEEDPSNAEKSGG